MSAFAGMLAAGAAARFSLYGEQVTLTPQANTTGDENARKGVDPARPAVTCVGIWDEVPTETYPDSRQMPAKASHGISAGTVTLTILKSALPYEPLQGDVAARASTGERLFVADPAFDGITEWELTLSARKS